METNELNKTYVPKDIIRKSSIKNNNTLLRTNQFQKTAGNSYIQFDPIQVKFDGYQVGKGVTATVRVINKAPIPQRIHILPPTQPGFSIKVNKKGSIAPGMSENIMVTFCSDTYKYQYDVIKINTQTQNFVVPIYAYPSIPKIRQIFPKLIDFGSVDVNSSQSNIYPIHNPVLVDFQYQFRYLTQSPAFIITPLHGIIQASSTENIQITFIPSEKVTYTVDAILSIKQFDFEPILIKLMGTGRDKKSSTLRPTKRIKSSKLNPLQNKTEKHLDATESINIDKNNQALGVISHKKSFIRSRTSFPKLLKKNLQTNNLSGISMNDKIQTNAKRENQKQYLSRFSRVSELDKEKQVKFSQYLGDQAMNEEQLGFEEAIAEEYSSTRLKNLQEICTTRMQNFLGVNEGEVEFAKYFPRDYQWDVTKNDELKIRKSKLELFMKAGSQIIEKYRLQKRLNKIKIFLSDCRTREDVVKKVEEDYQKSLDSANSLLENVSGKLYFSFDSLAPSTFPLQFQQQGQTITKLFETEGKPQFDDDGPLKQIKVHQTQRMGYININFPPDFVNLNKLIPQYRRSAEQQFPLRSNTLPATQIIKSSSIYENPLKIPTHHFICNNFEVSRYKNYNPEDEKSVKYLCNSTVEQIEDEFQGWSKGDQQILKIKFLKNAGCQFSGISLFSHPNNNDFGFMGELGSQLPKEIGLNNFDNDDRIEEGDSDQQKLNEIPIDKGDDLLTKLEGANPKAKQRRQQNKYYSYENQLYGTIQKNLRQIKLSILSQPVQKIKAFNKWSQKSQNKVLI